MVTQCPGDYSNHVDLVSEIKCLHSTVGLLPKKLPIQIRRWDGNAWHLLSSHEPVCLAGAAFTNFLTVVVRGGVRRLLDPELPVVNGSLRQFGAHGWQEPDGVRMRARRTARSA